MSKSGEGQGRPFSTPEFRLRRIFSPGSMNCWVDAERRIVVVAFVGTLSVQDALAAQEKVRATPGFDPSFHVLGDLTQADLSEITPDVIRRLVAAPPADRASRRALLVADDAAYGLARMFRAFAEIAGRGNRAEVFRDRDEAMRWLTDSVD